MSNIDLSDNSTERFDLHEIAILCVLSKCTVKTEDSLKKSVCSLLEPDRFSENIFGATAVLEELAKYINMTGENYTITQKGKERLFWLRENKPALFLKLQGRDVTDHG